MFRFLPCLPLHVLYILLLYSRDQVGRRANALMLSLPASPSSRSNRIDNAGTVQQRNAVFNVMPCPRWNNSMSGTLPTNSFWMKLYSLIPSHCRPLPAPWRTSLQCWVVSHHDQAPVWSTGMEGTLRLLSLIVGDKQATIMLI